MDGSTPWHRGAAFAIVAALIMVTPAFSSMADTTGSALAEETDGDVTVVRDQYGVPHVYGETAEDVSFGAGYTLAEDRLWQMHVFRLIAKGQLSELLGPVVIDTDKGIRMFTYTEDQRIERFENYPEDIQENLEAFRDGINAYLDHMEENPDEIPFEFAEYGEWPTRDWKVTDSVALSDLLILTFGAGGGSELGHAALLEQLREEHGNETGQAMFDDLVKTLDPDAPVTVPRGFDYVNNTAAARTDEVEDRRQLHDDARLNLEEDGEDDALALGAEEPLSEPTKEPAVGTEDQLSMIPDAQKAWEDYRPIKEAMDRLQRHFAFGSNAQIVGPSETESGNTAQTAGPQVGYLLPQWLSDFGLHSEDGELDATGMTFAGAGPAVLIGRGNGYAWTTTTGASDLEDIYIEKLNPEDPTEYWFDPDGDGPAEGEWRKISCREETYTFEGVPFDTSEVCRTHHGPVVATDEDNDTAYSLRMAWFNREQQTVEGFFGYNKVESLEDFGTFAGMLASNHNMFYTDDQGNYAFFHPGNHPDRKDGIDIRLPQDGTGGSEWEGLVPNQHTPHAVNFERGWLANWNNAPADNWTRENFWDPIDNADDIIRALNTSKPAVEDPHGGLVNPDRKVDYHDLDGNLRYGAFKSTEATAYQPLLPDPFSFEDETTQAAARLAANWNGFLTDRDRDGDYDSAGPTILDEWVDLMEAEAFQDDLGDLSGHADDEFLWHVVNPDDRYEENFDWLNGEDPADFRARTFAAAVDELAEDFDSEDPSTWVEEADQEHYQRLNADLFTDIAQSAAGVDNSEDNGFPGDVRDHIEMDRGTFNHIVSYQEEPTNSGELGESAAKAGSVIPPGQSGYISLTGQEDEHYEDQLDLYVDWQYKPMPMSEAEARDLAESVTTLER